MEKTLIIVGDRVLVDPDRGQDKTDAGLYLPQGVKEKEKVNAGWIVKTGPGYPIPDPSISDGEPWLKASKDKYFPLQAQEGDYCIFVREQGVDITFEKKHYIVIPHTAILVLIRENRPMYLNDNNEEGKWHD